MLSKIGVENFKLFKNPVEFELKPIIVLTGVNSCGKSTFNKLMSLIYHGFKVYPRELTGDIDLDSLPGDLNIERIESDEYLTRELGNIDQWLTFGEKKNFIKLFFGYNLNKETTLKVKLLYKAIMTDKVKSNWFLRLESIVFIYNDSKMLEIDYESFSSNESIKINELIDQSRHSLNSKLFLDYLIFSREKKVKKFLKRKKKGLNFVQRTDCIVFTKQTNQRNFISSNLFKLINSLPTQEFRKSLDSGKSNELLKMLEQEGIATKSEFFVEYEAFESKIISIWIERRIAQWKKSFNTEDGKLINLFSMKFVNKYDRFLLEEILKSIDGVIPKLLLKELNENLSETECDFDEYFENLTKSTIEIEGLTYDSLSFSLIAIEIEFQNLYFNFIDNLTTTISSNDRNYKAFNKIHNQIQDFVKYIMKDNVDSKVSLLFNFAEHNYGFLNKKFFYEYDLSRADLKLIFINRWLKKLNIGNELIIETNVKSDDVRYYSYFIEREGEERTNCADLSLGYRKMILLLIRLAYNSVRPETLFFNHLNSDLTPDLIKQLKKEKKRLEKGEKYSTPLFFEEPEVNLHPSFQSKLAEIFADAYYYFGNQYIIETHSEYLIRKFQLLIAKRTNLLKNEDLGVYYMFNPKRIPEGQKQVYALDIRPDGFMNNDFGKGFFDEASSLSLGLLNLPNFN